MARGWHYGHRQFRAYTGEYTRIFAKSFKCLLDAELGNYTINVKRYNEEHRRFELKESNKFRYMSFVINDQEHQIALKLDDSSASKKLYISCPYCQKKKQHLYAFKNGYSCRECLGLHYGCQSERPQERLLRRIRKLRVELWGSDWTDVYNMFEDIRFWPKPKWIRWSTFERKRDIILALEAKYWPLVVRTLPNLSEFDEETFGNYICSKC